MSLARVLKHLHLVMTVFWALMVPISIFTGIWRHIEYVTFLSLWALVVSEWAAWQASRAEIQADKAHKEREGQAPA